MPLVFRAAHHNPPRATDMMSAWALGKRPPYDNARQVRVYQDVSVFDSLQALRAKARGKPAIGIWAVTLDVSWDYIGHTRTNPETGHIGLIGTTPGELLNCVVDIQPI